MTKAQKLTYIIEGINKFDPLFMMCENLETFRESKNEEDNLKNLISSLSLPDTKNVYENITTAQNCEFRDHLKSRLRAFVHA